MIYQVLFCYVAGMKVMPAAIFRETIITVLKLTLVFSTNWFIINTFYPPLCETLQGGSIKLFREALELFTHTHTHTVFQFLIVWKTVFGVHPSGDQKFGFWRVLNQDCKEDETLICHPFWPNPIHSFNLFNVCTYPSELIVAPVFINSTNNIQSLSQRTLMMA